MNLTLYFVGTDRTSDVSVAGDVLTIDGTDYDLSLIPEGGNAICEKENVFVGEATRDPKVIYYYDLERYDASNLPEQPYTMTVSSGKVLPPLKELADVQ